MLKDIGPTEILLIPMLFILIAAPIFWIVMLVDALRQPDENYAAVGQTKIVWVLVTILLGAIGGVIYYFVVRKKLHALATGTHAVQSATVPAAKAAAGWYPDPDDNKYLAYWNGTEWEETDEKFPNR